MDSAQTMAQQIAQAANEFQERLTGHPPASVSVVLGADTLVITLHGALSAAEQKMVETPEGAAKVQEFHKNLFATALDQLRPQIKRITGMDVRQASAEVETKSGAVVQVFTNGTAVQVFLLSGNVPPGECGVAEIK